MAISEGDILRVVVSYSMTNASVPQNVYWMEVGSGEAGNEAFTDDFETWFLANYVPLWTDFASEDCSIAFVEIDKMNVNGTVAENIGSFLVDEPGLVAQDPSGAANSGFVKADTDIPKTAGKKYYPGLAEGDVSNNLITGDALADLALLLALLIADVELGGLDIILVQGVLSRVFAEFVPFNGSGYITDVPAYQRRRKPNTGS